MQTLSIGEALGFGWETFKKRPWFFMGAALIILVVNWLISKATQAFDAQTGITVIGGLVNLAAATIVGLGTIAFFLKGHDSVEGVSYRDLWHPRSFWKYLGTIILYGLIVLVAIIPIILASFLGIGALLIGGFSTTTGHVSGGLLTAAFILGLIGLVLAFYASATFIFAPYAVVDRALGPIKALKESKQLTKGHRWHVVGFIFVNMLVNLLGLVCLIVGILVTMPLTVLALAHMYRKLSGTSSTQASTASVAQA